ATCRRFGQEHRHRQSRGFGRKTATDSVFGWRARAYCRPGGSISLGVRRTALAAWRKAEADPRQVKALEAPGSVRRTPLLRWERLVRHAFDVADRRRDDAPAIVKDLKAEPAPNPAQLQQTSAERSAAQ